jgi:hypothetical protein
LGQVHTDETGTGVGLCRLDHYGGLHTHHVGGHILVLTVDQQSLLGTRSRISVNFVELIAVTLDFGVPLKYRLEGTFVD